MRNASTRLPDVPVCPSSRHLYLPNKRRIHRKLVSVSPLLHFFHNTQLPVISYTSSLPLRSFLASSLLLQKSEAASRVWILREGCVMLSSSSSSTSSFPSPTVIFFLPFPSLLPPGECPSTLSLSYFQCRSQHSLVLLHQMLSMLYGTRWREKKKE